MTKISVCLEDMIHEGLEHSGSMGKSISMTRKSKEP